MDIHEYVKKKMASLGRGPGVNRLSIMQAKTQGSLVGLVQLMRDLTVENYAVEVVDAVLCHIKRAWPPPFSRPKEGEEYPPMTGNALCAAYCVRIGLYTVLYKCPPHLFDQITAKIYPEMDKIVTWLDLLLYYPDILDASAYGYRFANPIKASLSFVHLSTRSGPEIAHDLLTSYKIIDYAIGAWALQDQGTPYMAYAFGHDKCPMSLFFGKVLSYSEDGRQRVFDVLLDNASLRERTIDNAVKRCEEIGKQPLHEVKDALRQRDSKEMSPMEAVVFFLDCILGVVRGLFKHPTLAKQLLKAGFFEAFFEALASWMAHKSHPVNDKEARRVAVKVAQNAHEILDTHASINRKLTIAATHQMIESGYLQVLAESMTTVPKSDPWSSYVIDMMTRCKNVVGQCPSAAHMIVAPLARLRNWEAKFLVGTGYEEGWSIICRDVLAGASRMMEPYFCDNIECLFEDDKLQVCSGCHTMAYCSKRCQRVDWESHHRIECSAARAVYTSRRARKNMHYTQRLRRSHALFTNKIANSVVRTSAIESNTVLRLDSWNHRTVTPEQYLESHGLLNANSDLDWDDLLDQRIKRLVMWYRNRPSQGYFLVEAQYPFGGKTVFCLVLSQKTALCPPKQDSIANPYTLRYCITRILD